MVIGYIYKITNTITNKIYIGQTRKQSVNVRFKQHLRSAFKKKSSVYNTKLSRAIRKYGPDKFIIEEVKKVSSLSVGTLCKILDSEEIKYISLHKATNNKFGYNISKGGQYAHMSHLEIEQHIKSKIKYDRCTVPGCDRKPLANGYCQKHYNQIYKHGHIFNRTLMDLNEIIKHDNYAEIILYNKKCQEIARTKIDLEDVSKVQNIKWGYHSSARGECAAAQTPRVILHNYLLNHTDKSTVVIHKNGDNLDNRKDNLVIISQTEKQQNNKIPSNNKSGYKGVWFCKERNKWQAQITVKNKTKSLGRFNTFEEAVFARKAGEEKYYTNS